MRELTPGLLKPLLLPRENDSHKGDYGHLLLVCGSNSYSGAAVLATGAALKSGCGLVTLHSCARALQATVNIFPSAMLSEDPAGHFSTLPPKLDKMKKKKKMKKIKVRKKLKKWIKLRKKEKTQHKKKVKQIKKKKILVI